MLKTILHEEDLHFCSICFRLLIYKYGFFFSLVKLQVREGLV